MTEMKNYIKGLYNILRDTFFAKNIGFSVIRLIFIKYASDNCLGAYTREEMQEYIRVQRMFAARDVGAGPNGLIPILSIMDRHYKLDNLMHKSINEYAKELFGLDDSWNKKNTSEKNFVEIMSLLSSMDFSDDLNTHEKGKILADLLIDNLQYHGENARLASPYYSRREIGQIASRILNVQDDETFLDFCSGIGSTTITIIGDKKCKIHNADINEESLSVAAMLYMMCGYEDFELELKDGFEPTFEDIPNYEQLEQIWGKADKIFVDPPLGLRIKNHPLREASVISMCEALSSLKMNGIAVVCVPSISLSGMGATVQTIREKFVSSGYLQSVISLPITWSRSTVSINLVVFSKKMNEKVLFANFCSAGVKKIFESDFKNAVKLGTILTEADIERIVEIINENFEIEGISRLVDMNEIANNSFDLTPNRYVADVIEDENITLKEIDEELASLYVKLINTSIQ